LIRLAETQETERDEAANTISVSCPRSSVQIRGKVLFAFISVYQCFYQCSSVAGFLVALVSF
jgi:hypothetical protein